MLEVYLGSILQPNKHVVLAYDDTINEELEHPHVNTLILNTNKKYEQNLNNDLINFKLETEINPHFVN